MSSCVSSLFLGISCFLLFSLLFCHNVVKIKVKSTMLHKRAWGSDHLPLSDLEPVSGEPLMSVTRGQCDARPTVTFRAARHQTPIGWYQIILLCRRGTRVLTTCPGLHSSAGRLGFEPATYRSQVRHPTATPPSQRRVNFLTVLCGRPLWTAPDALPCQPWEVSCRPSRK